MKIKSETTIVKSKTTSVGFMRQKSPQLKDSKLKLAEKRLCLSRIW